MDEQYVLASNTIDSEEPAWASTRNQGAATHGTLQPQKSAPLGRPLNAQAMVLNSDEDDMNNAM